MALFWVAFFLWSLGIVSIIISKVCVINIQNIIYYFWHRDIVQEHAGTVEYLALTFGMSDLYLLKEGSWITDHLIA